MLQKMPLFFFFQFFPPTWFICSTSVNHLLLVLNCIMNFIVYCCFNEKFKLILFQHQEKNQQNNSSPQQNQQIPSRNAEPKQRNITRVTGVIQTNFNHDPSEFAKKSILVYYYQNCSDLLWEKIVLVIEKNFWNSRLKVEKLQNFWDH